jgi:hypothetical protein
VEEDDTTNPAAGDDGVAKKYLYIYKCSNFYLIFYPKKEADKVCHKVQKDTPCVELKWASPFAKVHLCSRDFIRS